MRRRAIAELTSHWSFLLMALLLPPSSASYAAGAKVTVVFTDGHDITGELLAVTDSELIVSRILYLREDKLKADPDAIMKLNRREILEIKFSGKSYVPDGILLGAIAGIGIGSLVSYEPTGTGAYKSNFDPIGPGPRALIIGLIGGMVVGGILGHIASTRDESVGLEARTGLAFLRDFARYRERRPPEFLIK